MAAEHVPGVVVIGAKEIYDEVVATRVLVSPLPGRVEDHEQRLRRVEREKLAVEDYRLERAENDVRFSAHDRRIGRLETLGNRLSGAKGLIMWAGAGIGAATIAHFVH